MTDISDEDRRHFELIGHLRQLIQEIHTISREVHDFMEIQRHPMFNYSPLEGSMELPTAPVHVRLSDEARVITRDQWDSLVGGDLTPRQVYPQESTTGWDPAQNHV